MIKIKDLSKKFWNKEDGEVEALKPTSLEVKAGEIFGLLGPNGAGKTTFLRMLATVLTPTTGGAKVNGCDILTKQEKVKKSISFLSGNTKLYERLTSKELLSYFGQLYEISTFKIKDRSKKIFELLKMEEFVDKRIAELSTGQKQKTSIARCLLHDPQVYIFDEPTTGLDIITSKAIIEFIRREVEMGFFYLCQ